MTTMPINSQKQFRYSVIKDTGAEMRKFYTLKVAMAYSIDEEAIIMTRKVRA